MATKRESIVKCSVCGFKDTENYCSRCGSKLKNLPNLWTPNYKNLIAILQEFSLEIINPVFSFFKTAWLLMTNAEYFFESLFLKTKPINEMPFPLSSIWRKIDKDSFQNILNPIQFYLASLAPSILLTLFVALFGGITEIEKRLIEEFFLNSLNNGSTLVTGVLFLVYPLSVAFIFDVFTENDPIPYGFKYTFWIYMFGLIVAVPSLFLIIANIPFIPNYIMIGFIDNLLSNVDPSSAEKIIKLNSEILRGWYSIPQDAILIFMMFAFLGVIPYNVFGRIYNISRRRLILTLLVSTLSPLVFLTISLYTCCIPIVILIIGVAMYNIFRTKKEK